MDKLLLKINHQSSTRTLATKGGLYHDIRENAQRKTTT